MLGLGDLNLKFVRLFHFVFSEKQIREREREYVKVQEISGYDFPKCAQLSQTVNSSINPDCILASREIRLKLVLIKLQPLG